METLSVRKRTRQGRGYVVASLCSLVGAALGFIGGFEAFALACEGDGLECVGDAITVGIPSAFVASIAGCYAGLRLRAYDGAGRTAAFCSALLPAAFALSFWLVFAGLGLFGPVGAIAGAAVGARRLAVRSSTTRTVIEKKGDNT